MGKAVVHMNPRNINYNKAIKDRIEVFAPKTKTVRKDAVVMCNFIITSDEQTMKTMSPEQQQDFFEETMVWFGERYGHENLVNATVHLDETTPHMHLGVVPIVDERLSAKTLFDRKELISLQTDFVKEVGDKYGLERGKAGSERTHLSEERFKLEMAKEKLKIVEEQGKEIITNVKIASETIKILKSELLHLKEQKEALKNEIGALQSELKGKVLAINELHRIQPRTGFGGSLKDITIEDVENLKKTALEYNLVKSKLDKLQNSYEDQRRFVPYLEERVKSGRDKKRLELLETAFSQLSPNIREQLLPSKKQQSKSLSHDYIR